MVILRAARHAKLMDNLIREDDRAVYGDKGDANDRKQRQAEAAGVLWAVKAKAKPGHPLSISQRRRNRRFGKSAPWPLDN